MTFTKCKHKIYSTLFLFTFRLFVFLLYDKTYDTQSFVGHVNMRPCETFSTLVIIFPCPTHYRVSPVKCQYLCKLVQPVMPSVLWHCWLGCRKGIWPVKTWVVGCWHDYLSGVRCRLAYGPADVTATLSLASVKSILVLPFWYRLTRVFPEKGPLNVCVCVCLFCFDCHNSNILISDLISSSAATSGFWRQ